MSKDPIAWNIAGRLSDITYLYICPCMRYLCMHDIILNMQEGVFKYTLKDCRFVLSDSPV
jgi:hypothetical protein